MATSTPPAGPARTGADTPQEIAKTLGFALIGLVGLLTFVATIVFQPVWVVPLGLVLTALAAVVILGMTQI
ncbi:MAG: hypothetical protein RLY86_4305 [Pseudomonadota bacterium]|jgi:hypothetical protein